jgi:hypothetical protein
VKRRPLRLAAVAVVAAAAGSMLRAYEGGARTIDVHYASAPPGALEVTFRGDDGRFLHRTGFSPAAFRAHSISLPPGSLRVELRVGAEARSVEALVSDLTKSLEIRWPGVPNAQGP